MKLLAVYGISVVVCAAMMLVIGAVGKTMWFFLKLGWNVLP